ncbi:methylenetetrahydrofolate reductase [Actinoplanes sp. N902-109]|uniref:methylenetetrahydrofolate reductase n=1 Tax=Actinoplanes sp. (strain N902-109) TaxID=649831 RepID=UPI0003295F6E|nr:methylenetetrahydrofolate reductase [Actinoplanes sp. N902-109]AGL20650.1 5,10-methylenetetrahydrofolate reductase [Actinoplanes sp. N902-109]
MLDRIGASHGGFSVEFFPPRDAAGEQRLRAAIRQVEALDPAFVSVTYGAGGSSRDRTVATSGWVTEQTSLRAVGHLAAVGHSVTELRAVVGQYAAAGVHDILAVRGDPPGDPLGPWEPHPRGVTYAHELVALIRSIGAFSVGVAAFPYGHPRSADLAEDIRHLRQKVAAGADYAIAQLFFSAADYLRLRDRMAAQGCAVPLLPGIMPLTTPKVLAKAIELSGVRAVPPIATELLRHAADPADFRAAGIDATTRLCAELLAEGVPLLHFYSLNFTTALLEVLNRLTPAHRRG